MGDWGDDELGDAHLVGDLDGLLAEVDEGDEHFASEVGVDGSGCVGDGESLFGGEP